jgi:hypothetical protein
MILSESNPAPNIQSKPARKKRRPNRPPIDPAGIYSRAEAAFLTNVSLMTLIRARDAGHLSEFRAGRRCLHSGQQLLDWLEAGGKTA